MTASSHVPPQNIEAEESLLGAMLVAAPALTRVIDEVRLNADDFYLDKHATIFRCVHDLHAGSKPVDELSVTEALVQRNQIEEAGGKHYVSELAAKVPAAGNAKHYAEIVQQNSLLRRLLGAGQQIQGWVHERDGEPRELSERAEQLLADATRGVPGRLVAEPADLSRVRPVRWLWDRRLPLGYLSLLLGAEGIGKGTFTSWLIARITRGELPGSLEGAPAKVLIVGDEDGFDSVVVPRLYAACADLGMVHTLKEVGDDYLDIHRDAAALRTLILEKGYRLVFLDALLDTLGVETDDWKSKAVRDALRPLRRVAQDVDVVVLGSLHPNKGTRSTFRDLLSGSHAFNAVSRSSLLLARHPEDGEDSNRRILVRGKGNLSGEPKAFEFAIHGRDLDINGHGFSLPTVGDEVETELTIQDVVGNDLAAQGDQPTKRQALLGRLVEVISASGPLGQGEALRRVDESPQSRTGRRALQDAVEAGLLHKLPDGRYECPAALEAA